jgi:hypothetical protein
MSESKFPLIDYVLNHYEQGIADERQRIIDKLQSYFELTQWSEEHEGSEPNPEWDAGFQAALALVKAEDAPKSEQLTECECDPCDDRECSCRNKRCDFCKAKED